MITEQLNFSYPLGALVRLEVEFDRIARGSGCHQLIDPLTITLLVISPDAMQTTYVYGVDAEIIRDDVGCFHADIASTQKGDWQFRWEGTGAGQGAGEGKYSIAGSVFYP